MSTGTSVETHQRTSVGGEKMTNPKTVSDEAWKRIIVLKGEQSRIRREIERLKPLAVKEMRALGFSYDEITRSLLVGKVTAIRMFKEGK